MVSFFNLYHPNSYGGASSGLAINIKTEHTPGVISVQAFPATSRQSTPLRVSVQVVPSTYKTEHIPGSGQRRTVQAGKNLNFSKRKTL
ncbi:LOW QUALITY PROTEIN: hypothetical protein ElyMa_004276100 [Elysia marginata]|uniref:Uncharacterized protein n=1 Tax=Elysia marginata TaxID=1093978 RepID=A0AAV4GVB8_9GAST|nr:LOW QUALITY PROTEIN: hypothetical protein ElyMa_004276100 [Elysia marginata]